MAQADPTGVNGIDTWKDGAPVVRRPPSNRVSAHVGTQQLGSGNDAPLACREFMLIHTPTIRGPPVDTTRGFAAVDSGTTTHRPVDDDLFTTDHVVVCGADGRVNSQVPAD